MPSARDTLALQCPAKVNLALSVGPPRDDQMHPIASWMVATDFGDRLVLRRASDGDASRWRIAFADDAPTPQPIDWPLERDLAYRAHRLLAAHVGQPLAIEAELAKRLPAGAGLGGGSSDAAGVLVGLNRLFALKLPAPELMGLARQLGADVVFLVAAMTGSPSAIVTGTGETIEPAAPAGAVDLVLVLPPFGCPTGAVYGAFDREHARTARLRESAVRTLTGQHPLPADGPFNDLAEAAQQVQPRLAEAVQRVGEAVGMPVHVTGSGAAMFVVARSPNHAHALATAITQATGFAAVATRTLTG